jgi:hypothetical protein
MSDLRAIKVEDARQLKGGAREAIGRHGEGESQVRSKPDRLEPGAALGRAHHWPYRPSSAVFESQSRQGPKESSPAP